MSRLAAPVVAVGIGLICLSGSALGLYELSRATTPDRRPLILRFDTTADGLAKLAVEKASARDKNYGQAKALANTALALNPYNNDARLRLVFIDLAEHKAPTAEGVRLLRQSYDLAPYDAYAAGWRVRFVLEYWHAMPAEIQTSAVTEARAFLKTWSRVANMRETLLSVRSPAGAGISEDLLNGRPLGTSDPPDRSRQITLRL